jgi:hypothetical protein
MTIKFLTPLVLLCLFLSSSPVAGQKAKSSKAQKTENVYPANFTISKADFDRLFMYKPNEVINTSDNVYINQSTLAMNTLNGDTRFLKIKLKYFKNAWLLIQVNGEYSTQIFILSDDKSVFYKGSLNENNVSMVKCDEDEIVSE